MTEIFKEYVDVLQIMEKSLLGVISYAEENKMTESLYNTYVEMFVHEECDDLNNLKELLVAYQTINDSVSLKMMERLFIQLLGHFNVYLLILEGSKEPGCSAVKYDIR